MIVTSWKKVLSVCKVFNVLPSASVYFRCIIHAKSFVSIATPIPFDNNQWKIDPNPKTNWKSRTTA